MGKRRREREQQELGAGAGEAKDGAQVAHDKPKKAHKHAAPSDQERTAQFNFWFSESNIRRDRVLRKLCFHDGAKGTAWVPLNTFLKFNKVKDWGSQIPQLADICRASTTLQLSDDGQKVRRKSEVQLKTQHDEDAATVYVENIGPAATHSSVRTQFKRHGRILYISLPCWQLPAERRPGGGRPRNHDEKKTDNDLPKPSAKPKQISKGFCFIEFECASDAQSCVAAFATEQSGGTCRVLSKPDWSAASKTYRDTHVFAYPKGAVVVVTGICDAELAAAQDDVSTEPTELTVPTEESPTTNPLQQARIYIQESAEVAAGLVAFVDYSPAREPGTCKIRFYHPSSATRYMNVLQSGGVVPFGGEASKPSACLLEGEEEIKYWREVERRRRAKAAAQDAAGKRSTHVDRKAPEASGSHIHFEDDQ